MYGEYVLPFNGLSFHFVVFLLCKNLALWNGGEMEALSLLFLMILVV